ncbi:NAD(P)/FAD-dependent oxidoreductase [Leptospira sp. 201903070]|uniref:NAD(P)/FAD-dependent oxidoreductase n=1 Tax=Leptospira ainlahdjerensis TaxID=2810033 RepID=A0ABS2UFT8_9LEPT|nr:FAD/NAD(P)-binding oxidoreductase [Leptospira ainlahdjerensis]MBM9579222.1 NAD(P)/FAD-dependent oxidoreductase [Leptospira ainlahdjerensis]
MKRVVIIGAGIGGIVVARELRKKNRNVEIIMIDRSEIHTFSPSLLWALVGKRKPNDFQKKIRSKGVNLIVDSVLSIDWNQKIVNTISNELSYDYLVLSPGADLNPEKISGFSDGAFNLYSVDGVMKAKEKLFASSSGNVTILISSLPFKCPAAPYEAALLIDSFFKERKIQPKITIVTPEEMPMSAGGPEAGIQVVELLKQKGISFQNQRAVTKIDSDRKELIFSNEERLDFNLLIGIPAHLPPMFLKDSPIVTETGWVKVDPVTLNTSLPNVYAIGDVTTIALPSGKPLPKAGVFAHAQAEIVASRIADEISLRTPKDLFRGEGGCFLEVGAGKAGFATGRFYSKDGPGVSIRRPSRFWHFAKVLFEKWWLWRWV